MSGSIFVKSRKLIRRLFKRFTFFAYNIDAPEYLENFLIFAVTAIFAIRIFLQLTGFPQIGRETLHIAHMLWGGLLMFVAIFVLLTFLNKEAKHVGSIVGGLGFGIFIDELGKFITKDNNYFYQPTFALLYIFFVVLFLGTRKLFRRIQPDEKDYAINALELTKEVVFINMDIQEKQRALQYLYKSDRTNPVVNSLLKSLGTIQPSPDKEVRVVERVKEFFSKLYFGVIRRRRFAKVIAVFFVLYTLFNIIEAVSGIKNYTITFWNIGSIGSTLTTGLLSAVGIYYLFKRRLLLAYEKFKQGVMVSILLGHFFAFYQEQLSAAVTLLIAISIYSALQYLIEQEITPSAQSSA